MGLLPGTECHRVEYGYYNYVKSLSPSAVINRETILLGVRIAVVDIVYADLGGLIVWAHAPCSSVTSTIAWVPAGLVRLLLLQSMPGIACCLCPIQRGVFSARGGVSLLTPSCRPQCNIFKACGNSGVCQ